MYRQPIRAARLLLVGLAATCCLAAATILPAFGQNTSKDTTEPPERVLAVERELLEKAAAGARKHRMGEATISLRTVQGKPLAGAKVQVEQVGHEFLVGCTIFDLVWPERLYKPELYKERFQGLFNFAVFPFYWRRYEARPGETVEEAVAKVATWCRENGITTKGHPLVWTNRSGVPDWVRKRSPEESEKALLGRVTREVGNLAGLIDVWDVVNEPVNCRAWDHVDSADYVHEPINRIADYVEKTFRAAHRANPQAILILNEYNTIARPEVRDRFFQLVTELKGRGTPIGGLGIQAHEPREHWYPPEEVLATFDRLASFGYPLHVTEFIPQSGGKDITGGWREGKWTELAQADFAEQFFRLCFGHPAVASINWWGMSDRRIWLPGGGLVDEEYRPKPVYRRLKKLLDEEWHTTATAETNAKGTAQFRGFFGKYAITVTGKDGKSRSFEAALKKGEENRWTFTVEE